MTNNAPLLIGIDVGGTFTDLTVYNSVTGAMTAFKAPSDRTQPDAGVIAAIAKSGINLSAIGLIVHGTTVATNAMLERKGARTAMVTTAGFRDVIELGRTTRLVPNTLYDPYFKRPAPLVARRDRHVLAERAEADGSITQPIDMANLMAVADRMAADGIEAVAVCFINSYRNPEHEQQVVASLRQRFEYVCGSVDILNEIREYERFSTCVVNAYVMPVMVRYVRQLVGTLARKGSRAPFFTMASHGGLLSDRMVAHRPVQTILSGPAAGVAAASRLMKATGRGDYITYDMGGTSTDVALVSGGEWPLKRETVINGMIIKAPQLDINTIGAGGGSIARIDAGGSLTVGPESAGADPGPACYGKGGQNATVSDANVVLGRIGPGQRMGGSLTIDSHAAERAIDELARATNTAPHEMADGIVRLAVAKMAAALYEVSVARGYDPREFAIVSFGGAGPLHACLIADEIGIPRVVVPPDPGAFSALGTLCTVLARDRTATILEPLTDKTLRAVEAEFLALERAIQAEFETEGIGTDRSESVRQIDARYVGQAHEITLDVPAGADVSAILRLFEAEFEREFGRLDRGRVIEIVNVRVFLRIHRDPPRMTVMPAARLSAVAGEPRQVYVNGAWHDCMVIERARLCRGARIEGPLVIEEMSATLFLPAGWAGHVGEFGQLELTRERERTGT